MAFSHPKHEPRRANQEESNARRSRSREAGQDLTRLSFTDVRFSYPRTSLFGGAPSPVFDGFSWQVPDGCTVILDPAATDLVIAMLRHLHELTNATVMVATHSPTVAALASRRIDVGQGDTDGPVATVPGEANRQ